MNGSFDVLVVDIDDDIISLGVKLVGECQGQVMISSSTVDATDRDVSVGKKRRPPSVAMEAFNCCLKSMAKCVADSFEVSVISATDCVR